MSTITYTVSTSFGEVPVTVTERGQGRPVLLLHGGAGPDSVATFAELVGSRSARRVLTPTNPGFNATPRPDRLDSIRKLAEAYRRLLDELDLTDVTVVGNSIGGWIAAELTLIANDRVDKLVMVNAVGLESAEHPAADFFSLTLDQVIDISFADPDAHRIDPSTLTEKQQAIAAANRAALRIYGGRSMADPSLSARLAGISVPTLVIWGEADRMVTPAYGKQYAEAIPGAALRLIPGAGHLPQIETPDALLALIDEFIGTPRTAGDRT